MVLEGVLVVGWWNGGMGRSGDDGAMGWSSQVEAGGRKRYMYFDRKR